MSNPPKPSRSFYGTVGFELSVVVPLFLLLVFGIVQFGRGLMANNMANGAAREAVRMAVQEGATRAEVTSAVYGFMNSALGLGESAVQVTILAYSADRPREPILELADCRPGDLVTVRVEVPFSKVALIPEGYLPAKQLIGECSLRYE